MELIEYGAEDAALVEAARLVVNAARAADAPWQPRLTQHRWSMEVRHGWDGSPVRRFVGMIDGEPVASVEIELGEWDNTDFAWLHLCVDPAHRRQGHGSEMLSRAMDLSRSVGRTKIGGSGWELPATRPFAAEHGFELASVEMCRVLFLDDAAAGRAEQVSGEAGPHAGDYELLRLSGATPPELLPAVAELVAAINDAPLDDLDIEDEVFPVERILDYERSCLESGHRLYRLVARHRETGELAGHTVVLVDAESPELGHQHDTAVSGAHRGHRLGLLLKAEMMRWLDEWEPQLASIDTWNAESNAHMVAVNERLGYEAVARELAFQRRL